MATINTAKIVDAQPIAAGDTYHVVWYPPWNTGLSYFAFADPPAASGEHGSTVGTVEITKITSTHRKKNDGEDTKQVDIYVKNVGTTPCGFNLYETWVS